MKLAASGGAADVEQSIGGQEDNSTQNSNNPDLCWNNGTSKVRRTTSRGAFTQYMGSNNGQIYENGGWVSPLTSNLALYQADFLNEIMGRNRPRWWFTYSRLSRNYIIKLKAFTFGHPLPNSELQGSLSMDNVFKHLWSIQLNDELQK